MANAAVMAVQKSPGRPYDPKGPFQVIVTMAPKKEALSIGKHWKINRKGANLLFETDNFPTLFWTLSRLAYLRPWSERLLPIGLPLYHLMGRTGLAWVKKKAPALDKNQG
ncbi:MAG: hypothetical protein HUK40_16055 [Desulfobacter sp.]|nr:hypothetical protein [Desulfobacter sp.]